MQMRKEKKTRMLIAVVVDVLITLERLSHRKAREVVKKKLGLDMCISNIHYRLKRLEKLRDVINEKILEVDMSFLKKAGVRGIVID